MSHADCGLACAGVYNGTSLGTPICVMVPNKDQQSGDYTEMDVAYRQAWTLRLHLATLDGARRHRILHQRLGNFSSVPCSS